MRTRIRPTRGKAMSDSRIQPTPGAGPGTVPLGVGEPFAPPPPPSGRDVAVPPGTAPTFKDYPRLVVSAPYFTQNPLAEMFAPAVYEAALSVIPGILQTSSLLADAVDTEVRRLAVLRVGDTMTGALFMADPLPTMDFQVATKLYVDLMLADGGGGGGSLQDVPLFPTNEIWARVSGAWVPISDLLGGDGGGGGGNFLSVTGGTMLGVINMNGNTVDSLAPAPALPNGAAPAQWVLDQITSAGFVTSAALTGALAGYMPRTGGAFTGTVTLHGPAASGSQPVTLDQMNTALAGIGGEGGGIPEPLPGNWLRSPGAWVAGMPLGGGTFTGTVTLYQNATSGSMQPVTMAQLETLLAALDTSGGAPDLSGFMPKSGGAFTGAVSLAGDAQQPLGATTLQQVQGLIAGSGFITSSALAAYMPRAGGTFTGAIVLAGDGTGSLNPVSLQQLNTRLNGYATVASLNAFLPLSGGSMGGNLLLNDVDATQPLQAVPLRQVQGLISNAGFVTGTFLSSQLAAYMPRAGGAFAGAVTLAGDATAALNPVTLQQLDAKLASHDIVFSDTAPASPSTGDLWFDTVNNVLKTWNGSAWVAAATPTGFLPLTGGVLTGSLAAQISTGNAYLNVTNSAPLGAGSGAAYLQAVSANADAFVNLSGNGNSFINMSPGNSQIYSGAAYFGIGLSGPFTDVNQWRLMYDRATGNLNFFNFNGQAQFSSVFTGDFNVRGVLNQGSDARDKHAISNASDGLDVVRRMQPRRFSRNHTPERTELGFVAQDLQPVLPDAVSESEGRLSVALTPLVAALINAVKELAARLEKLEAKAA